MGAMKSMLATVLICTCTLQCMAQATECAFQVFGELPCKSVSVKIGTSTYYAAFSGGEAQVLVDFDFLKGAGSGVTVYPTSIETTFVPYYSGCAIDVLTLNRIGDGSTTGECFTVRQRCPGKPESIFGKVYVDLWCREPLLDLDDYPDADPDPSPFKVSYTQSSTLAMGEGC